MAQRGCYKFRRDSRVDDWKLIAVQFSPGSLVECYFFPVVGLRLWGAALERALSAPNHATARCRDSHFPPLAHPVQALRGRVQHRSSFFASSGPPRHPQAL